ncbi:Plasmodium exported protein, unknown function, partial [Plasmodium vivax]
FPKSIEKIYEHEQILKVNFTRLLARYEQNTELEHTGLRKKISDRSPYKKEKNAYGNISTYSQVKRKAPNYIDVYMKNYKNRYIKKRGLSKLDCYYENKVFDKFNQICDIGKKMKYDEKRSKKFFLKKYGIGLILFALIPVLGFIFPILFGFSRKMPGILGPCTNDHFYENNDGKHKNSLGYQNCSSEWIEKQHTLIQNLECANFIFTIIMVSIVILFIIYILIKVIKYEKIKAGKGKMNRKEYMDFCKKIF